MCIWLTYRKFELLTFCLRWYQFTCHFKACSNFWCGNFIKVRHCTVNDYLDVVHWTSIIELNERKVFSTILCFDPSRNCKNVAKILLVLLMECCNSNALSVAEVWYWFFLDRSVSHEVVLNFSFIAIIIWSVTITSSFRLLFARIWLFCKCHASAFPWWLYLRRELISHTIPCKRLWMWLNVGYLSLKWL